MAKPQENKKPQGAPVVDPIATAPVDQQNPVDVKNALDSFINSDNTDMDNEKNEAQVNDKIDDDLNWGEESHVDETPENLKDIPRKYWKHQTV